MSKKFYSSIRRNRLKMAMMACSVAVQDFFISEDHPFLGASPDAMVLDPSVPDQFRIGERKFPYSVCNITPAEACSSSQVNYERRHTAISL